MSEPTRPRPGTDDVDRPTVLVLNGPNLNLLGTREPEIYGRTTLADVEQLCRDTAAALGLAVDVRQSNAEGDLIDAVQAARSSMAGIVINPAGYSHTSIALMDALSACDLPIVEVHLSNIHRREEFRHLSYVSKVAGAVIAGCGAQGYAFGLQHVAAQLLGGGRGGSPTGRGPAAGEVNTR